MRIGVTGDTHASLSGIQKAMAAAGRVDCWLHTGDYLRDAAALERLSGVPCHAVAGNGDGFGPTRRVVELAGVRVFLTHGHRYRDAQAIVYAAQQEDCSVAVCGHTHVPRLERWGGVLLLNPGSPVRPRGNHPPSCALLTIASGQADARLLFF